MCYANSLQCTRAASFRLGTIGNLHQCDMERIVSNIGEVLKEMNVTTI